MEETEDFDINDFKKWDTIETGSINGQELAEIISKYDDTVNVDASD